MSCVGRVGSVSSAVFIGVLLAIAAERRAWGYVDPGSGLLAFQALASIVAGFGYCLRRRIRRFFQLK